jgi:hypothetical protein
MRAVVFQMPSGGQLEYEFDRPCVLRFANGQGTISGDPTLNESAINIEGQYEAVWLYDFRMIYQLDMNFAKGDKIFLGNAGGGWFQLFFDDLPVS